jgi:hypothetical protein
MILTDDNYYSVEADREFLSCSQYQGFMECEAKQLAKLQGRWTDKPSKAFLVGNFFRSYFESPEAHAKFCRDNIEEIYTSASVKKYYALEEQKAIIKATGGEADTVSEDVLVLLNDYKIAEKMIDAVMKDEFMCYFVKLPGENEKIVQGDIFGVPWRGKLDKYIPNENFIIDYKTVANIWETSYNPVTKQRETFVEHYGYIFRAAVYSLLELEMRFKIDFHEAYRLMKEDVSVLMMFVLLCVSKQDYPDKRCISLNHQQAYIKAIEDLKNYLPRVKALREGKAIPKRCGMCDYCRATNKVKEITPYYELIPEFRKPREYDDEELEAAYDNRTQTLLVKT